MIVINVGIIPGSITNIALPTNNGGNLAIASASADIGTVLVLVGKSKQPPPQPPFADGLDLSVWTDPKYPLEVYAGQLIWDPSPTVLKWFKQIGFSPGSEIISITQLSGGPMAAVVELV